MPLPKGIDREALELLEEDDWPWDDWLFGFRRAPPISRDGRSIRPAPARFSHIRGIGGSRFDQRTAQAGAQAESPRMATGPHQVGATPLAAMLRKTSTTFDDWTIARRRLDKAQLRLIELHGVIAGEARHLEDWINIKARLTSTITMPGFTNWPVAESLRDAAREFRDALSEETSAFCRCPYAEQQRISGIKGKRPDGRQRSSPAMKSD
jgi:hypothetical protein